MTRPTDGDRAGAAGSGGSAASSLGAPRLLTGRERLEAVSTVLQRRRNEHPTAGNFEASDLQWWTRQPRPTDQQPQPVWFDAADPLAAVTATRWSDGLGVDVHVPPSLTDDDVAQVWAAAFDLAAGEDGVFVWCADDDPRGASLLAEAGWVLVEDTGVSGWMDAAAAPPVSPLADGYRLRSRADRPNGPHPFVARNGPDVEARLQGTALYRPDLDLVAVTEEDEVAAYALLWFDPVTQVGLVEPMRTEEDHQRRGLARHLLTAGIHRLVALGAERIRISWEDDNPASSTLYPDVGFVPTQRMHTYQPGA
ncbi:GNAT family N-acetyltransferase [Nitriliruptor alkaliphilus]|uniref:GNAT family N-acetyltransferase n=1 Tax=Nitriliruptor alkaliphilus TaxID=427918 RepID=UPI0012ECEDC3|nr:GNAT family N-acetyltransferase [Nitriliruptor alkaliphilus]